MYESYKIICQTSLLDSSRVRIVFLNTNMSSNKTLLKVHRISNLYGQIIIINYIIYFLFAIIQTPKQSQDKSHIFYGLKLRFFYLFRQLLKPLDKVKMSMFFFLIASTNCYHLIYCYIYRNHIDMMSCNRQKMLIISNFSLIYENILKNIDILHQFSFSLFIEISLIHFFKKRYLVVMDHFLHPI